ncbi:MAG TPA: hypothetical protein DCG14_04810, partial [Phycisphaerales bacterium]|nr:hypothetical protein [Phycisphaerales bacterium]
MPSGSTISTTGPATPSDVEHENRSTAVPAAVRSRQRVSKADQGKPPPKRIAASPDDAHPPEVVRNGPVPVQVSKSSGNAAH